MFSAANTTIPQGLIEAYLGSDFLVHASPNAPTFTLRMGETCPVLSALYRATGCTTAAFITAWNPYSVTQPDGVNQSAQSRLVHEVETEGLKWLAGTGFDPKHPASGEDSILVVGLTQQQAIDWGSRFQQNAIVWVGANARPELLLLK